MFDLRNHSTLKRFSSRYWTFKDVHQHPQYIATDVRDLVFKIIKVIFISSVLEKFHNPNYPRYSILNSNKDHLVVSVMSDDSDILHRQEHQLNLVNNGSF